MKERVIEFREKFYFELVRSINCFLREQRGELLGMHLIPPLGPEGSITAIIVYSPFEKEETRMKESKGKKKVEKVMHEFKEGELHSGSKKGPEVKNPKQAIAIALSEARKSGAKIPKKGKK